MKKFILKVILTSLAFWLVAQILPGVSVDNTWTILLAVLALGVVNTLVRPLLIILTLPITILTIGLFVFVINGLMFWLVSQILPGFTVDGLTTAIVGSFLLSVFTSIFNWLIKDD